MTFHTHRQQPQPSRPGAAHVAPAPRVQRHSPAFFVLATGLALALAAAVFGASAQAQTAAPKPVPAATLAVAAPAEPKYTATQIEQAFSFIDGNKDGKLSREEAAGFRGVARHFDEADTNKDGALSRKEFENALSGEKAR